MAFVAELVLFRKTDGPFPAAMKLSQHACEGFDRGSGRGFGEGFGEDFGGGFGGGFGNCFGGGFGRDLGGDFDCYAGKK